MLKRIETMTGVTDTDGTVWPAVEVERGAGDTVVDLRVTDDIGQTARVHLDRDMLVSLVLALAAVGVDL